MAGIGFELRKVVGKGGIGSFFQMAMSGAMIVAGPWILSIITITLIQTLLNRAAAGGLELFMGVVIYCYAFSLFLFGGFHYLFTRRMSDLLYLKKEGEAFGYVLRLCIPVGLISAAIALPAALHLSLDIPSAALFRASAVLLFVTVNILWIIMLFVSVLKWYIKIMFVYTAGLVSSLLLISLLSGPFGLTGALLGFSLGHLMIVLLLMLLSRVAYKPERPAPPHDITASKAAGPAAAVSNVFRYAARHRHLFGAGVFYYAGIWIDKLIYWAAYGENVSGTFIRLFAEYDIPVYLANLTMIPGLVFFVVYSETEFYTSLKRFLLNLGYSRYSEILRAKQKLAGTAAESLKEQSILQGVVTLIIIILASGTILRTTLAAVFFHLLLLTLLNYLFYIEQYRHAFLSAVVFFLVNGVLAALTAFSIIPPHPRAFLPAWRSSSLSCSGFTAEIRYFQARTPYSDKKIVFLSYFLRFFLIFSRFVSLIDRFGC